MYVLNKYIGKTNIKNENILFKYLFACSFVFKPQEIIIPQPLRIGRNI